jgi:hypothetical protein
MNLKEYHQNTIDRGILRTEIQGRRIKNKKRNCRNMKRRIMILMKQKKIVIILKTQLEEAKRIEEVVRIPLKGKEENCKKLDIEIVSIKKELEKTTD